MREMNLLMFTAPKQIVIPNTGWMSAHLTLFLHTNTTFLRPIEKRFGRLFLHTSTIWSKSGWNFRGTDMNKIHQVQEVKFEDGKLLLTVDGQTVSKILTDLSPRLANASDAVRNHFVISPSGYGIHWPDCDEDLSIDALLGIRHIAPMIAAEDPVEYRTSNNN